MRLDLTGHTAAGIKAEVLIALCTRFFKFLTRPNIENLTTQFTYWIGVVALARSINRPRHGTLYWKEIVLRGKCTLKMMHTKLKPIIFILMDCVAY